MRTWNPFQAANPAGIGQQTIAGQVIGSGMTTGRARAPSRKKRAKRAAPSTAKRSTRAKRGRPARLVKGSAAAKAHMAKIRRKRRK
jgi:hypothetical protein